MSFKNYLKTLDTPGIIFNFSRMSPPHNEHYILTQDMVSYAKKYKLDAVLYTSQSVNQKKNPLQISDKILFLKSMVPKGVRISEDSSLKTPFAILEDLIKNKGYTRIVFMVGSDRVNDFQRMYQYAKEYGKEIGKEIDFKVQQRKAKRTEGMSGTHMRQYAKNNDFESFSKFAPSSLSKAEIKSMFNKTKIGMGI